MSILYQLSKLDKDLPAILRNTALTSYEIARKNYFRFRSYRRKNCKYIGRWFSTSKRVVVSSGAITLERASSVIHVGLEYNSDLQTLP